MYFGDIFRQGILEFFADASVGNNCKDTKTDAGKRADQIVNPAGNPADNVRVTSFSNNTYFHKVQGNLKLYKSNCGIIIAINDPTKAAIQVANSNYLRDNTIIVSINYQELKKIVYDNLNFLDLLENKVVMLKTNATTYLGDNKVFEQSK